MNPIPLAITELRRHLLGAVAIVLLIAVAVAFGIAVTSSERALRESSARAADRFDLIIGAPGSATQLVLTTVYLQAAAIPLIAPDVLPRILADLTADKGVAYAAPVAVGDSFGAAPIVGTTCDFVIDGGRMKLTDGRNFANKSEAVLGANVDLKIGATFQAAHGSAAEQLTDAHTHSFRFTVVGRLPKTGTAWDNAILVPIETIWGIHAGARLASSQGEALGPPRASDAVNGVPAIVVRVKSPGDAYRLRGIYRGIVADSGNERNGTRGTNGRNGTMAIFPAEVLVELYALIGDMRKVMTTMSLATQGIVLLAVLLVMISALSVRQQTIAVLRAMGAPKRYIFAMIWLQGFMLIGLGAALGLGFGWVGSAALVKIFAADIGLAIIPTIGTDEFLMAATVLVAGSILAMIPTAILWRENIAQKLRN